MILDKIKQIFTIFRPKSKTSSKTSLNSENNELYIGNIDYRTKPHELRKLFEDYGVVEYLKIIRDPRTKRSKGYGFVKFKHTKDAANALKNNNAKFFNGRELKIDFAKDK